MGMSKDERNGCLSGLFSREEQKEHQMHREEGWDGIEMDARKSSLILQIRYPKVCNLLSCDQFFLYLDESGPI